LTDKSLTSIDADICIIGAGSGGLTVAAVAARLGVKTVLVEKAAMGGDCLNTGCVPSKALLAAAHAASAVKNSHRFGVDAGDPQIDGRRVHDHIHDVIAAIAPHDSVERFEEYGVQVINQTASFVGRKEVVAGDTRIKARRFVVATGSNPLVPPIPGIENTPYLTNETIFDLTRIPDHLIVIGGGPIGIEMAQAYRRLGADVTVLEMATILPRDDPELSAILKARLVADGVILREGAKVIAVDAGISVAFETGGGCEKITGSHLLVAAGRRPKLAGLDLERAGIKFSDQGISVDRRLRTSNKKIFAIGDVIGGHQFTHIATYHAGIVIKNALFRLPAKVDEAAYPWVSFTSPELAQVGLTEADAKLRHKNIRTLSWPFEQNDRAVAEGRTDGLIKVVTTTKGYILGVGIVGPQAGELIQVWGLAIGTGLKIGKIANMIAPYPTLGEANKRIAGEFFTPALFGGKARKIVNFLAKFG